MNKLTKMTSAVRLVTGQQWNALLSSVDTVLFDCDGVFWVGSSDPVPGANEAIAYIRSVGKNVAFVSNNSSKSRQQYLQKFSMMGIEAYEHEVFSTSYVTAYYLKHHCNYSGKVYLSGTQGFADELQAMGMTCIGMGPDPVQGVLDDWLKMELDPDVGAVVIGHDPQFSYLKMVKACSYIHRKNSLFIASNLDGRLPAPGPVVIPGTGCNVNAISFEAGPPIVIGKPCKPLYDCIAASINIEPARTLMVGDRLNTDILFGKKFGFKTLAVLSGITDQTLLDKASPDETPDFYADSIGGAILARTS